MSSGFVSGGTTDAPIERSDEWLAAQTELEANRARKAAAAQQPEGRSLFETLEANKAAKQEAFEEANRLKNQFRALDQDEVDFLDSVLESTRKEEDRVKKETAEGLELFRKQQEEADKKARIGDDQSPTEATTAAEEELWTAGARKRKRAKEKEGLKGVKIRRSSSTLEPGAASPDEKKREDTAKHTGASQEEKSTPKTTPKTTATGDVPTSKSAPAATKPKAGLSLVDYGSDEDDD